MTRWETDILYFPADATLLVVQERLDALGAEGWEPVSMALSDGRTLYVLLKRPKADEAGS